MFTTVEVKGVGKTRKETEATVWRQWTRPVSHAGVAGHAWGLSQEVPAHAGPHQSSVSPSIPARLPAACHMASHFPWACEAIIHTHPAAPQPGEDNGGRSAIMSPHWTFSKTPNALSRQEDVDASVNSGYLSGLTPIWKKLFDTKGWRSKV